MWRLVRLFLIIVLIVVIMRSFLRGWNRRTPGRRRRRRQLDVAPRRRSELRELRPDPALLLHLQLRDPHGPAAADGHHADPRLRARRRRLGRQARRRPRPEGGEGGGAPHRLAVAVGRAFEPAGGKRERGLLFLGAPGTGKTMLAKAIATGFNCPFISIPGSGFAQTFIGIDVIIVRCLARKAKKLAAKWGGQCIVFIDEIDAVGRRRAGVAASMQPTSLEDLLFFGPHGALNPSGDMILETRAWRDKLFAPRAPEPGLAVSGWPAPDRQPGRPRRRWAAAGTARAEPAADHDGRRRQPAVLPARPHELDEPDPRRPLHRSGPRPRALAPAAEAEAARATRSTSSARRTSRSTRSTPR